jgi:cytochrome P450
MSEMAADPATYPTLEGFDPLSQEYFRDPFPTWDRARRERPVFFWAPLRCWFLSRYDDVARALSDWRTFSSDAAVGLVSVPAELRERVPASFYSEPFIGIDPPRHTVSRKAANKGFTRGRIAEHEERIRQIANEEIDGFIAERRCDLMQQYCFPLSLRTIARLLGVPEADVPMLKQWAGDLVTQLAPKGVDLPPTPDRHERWTRLADASDYFARQVRQRMSEPTDDLISALVHAKNDDGTPALSPERAVTHPFELIAAGSDTTASLVAHMVLLLARHSDQLEELRRDTSLWDNAVEEGLRLRGSSWGIFRIATTEVELSGTIIPAGSLIYVNFLSACHDERYFASSSKFDIHRANADQHLAFGRGRHFCLGAPLARVETRIGLETLFERIPELALADPQELEYEPSIAVPMLKHLEVRW